MTITELVKGNKVYFHRYRQGHFYYYVAIERSKPAEMYEFTVPLDDIGTATMLSEDKAITYMRWIKKAIENNTLIKL